MRSASQVAWQIVDGEAIVVDLGSGKTIGLNPTATFLWSQLDGRDETELARALVSDFDVDPDQAASDVRDFLRTMRERNLIAES
jgi:hypothetical protein